MGLQLLPDKTVNYLATVGLTLNADKCFAIGIKGQPKQKCTVFDPDTLRVALNGCPALKLTNEWKYLGIIFNANGRVKCNPAKDIGPKLQRLSQVPLKSQQKICALRTVPIIQLYHKCDTIGVLRKSDKLIRFYVSKWLDLPPYVPIAFVHAPQNVGHSGFHQ